MGNAVLSIDKPRCCGECDSACDDIAGLFCNTADWCFDGIHSQKDRTDWCRLREVESKQILRMNLL